MDGPWMHNAAMHNWASDREHNGINKICQRIQVWAAKKKGDASLPMARHRHHIGRCRFSRAHGASTLGHQSIQASGPHWCPGLGSKKAPWMRSGRASTNRLALPSPLSDTLVSGARPGPRSLHGDPGSLFLEPPSGLRTA